MMRASQQPYVADLAGYPDLTIVYLGMKVTRLQGILTLMGLGKELSPLARNKPDGLLHQDTLLWRFDHVGIRQYWRDFDALERFTRSEPHKGWWRDFLRDQKGTAFWHETYRNAGGVEGVYIGLPTPVGLGCFAAHRPRSGEHATARRRSEIARAA